MDGVVERKMPARMILIIVVVIILLFSTIYFVSRDEAGGITAMDGYNEANAIALNRSNGSILCGVIIQDKPDNNGMCSGWRYYYLNNLNDSVYEGFDVTVYDNHTTSVYEYGSAITTPSPINNWTIDSNEATNIALSNDEITQFFHKYRHSSIDIFSLNNWSDYSNPFWYIAWVDWGFIDDPHWAQIHIDATTGEVLYVEVDN